MAPRAVPLLVQSWSELNAKLNDSTSTEGLPKLKKAAEDRLPRVLGVCCGDMQCPWMVTLARCNSCLLPVLLCHLPAALAAMKRVALFVLQLLLPPEGEGRLARRQLPNFVSFTLIVS